YEPLVAKSIDTGLGMERIVALMQGVKSIFEIDSVKTIMDHVAKLANTEYGQNAKADVSLRVITDHARGITFLISDGVLPSNEGRGYVLRRLLRRAARHGRLLGIEGQFLNSVVDVVIGRMQVGYPELKDKQEYIHRVVDLEERRFYETLDQGINILQEIIANHPARGPRVIPGTDVFRLYDTYGFPVELTREIAEEHGFAIDEAGFEEEMNQQRERARRAHAQKDYGNQRVELYRQLQRQVESLFVGYEQTECSTHVAALVHNGRLVERLGAGEEGLVVLTKTPFYAASGGQVADTGTITGKVGQFSVKDVRQPVDGIIAHQGVMVGGELVAGDQVVASVYSKERWDTARHHSATHLLHRALREVLGDHVHQSGSDVDSNRVRFDFTHFEAVTDEQLHLVEAKVNEAVMANHPVQTEILSMDEAKAKGAIALFGEKYGSAVRVVSMGESMELCGGTHVSATGDIGLFRIVSESSIAAGVRRIEAVAGKRALEYTDRREKALLKVSGLLETTPDLAVEQLERLLEQHRKLQQELNQYQRKAVSDLGAELVSKAEVINGVNVVIAEVNLAEAEQMRSLGDQLRDRLNPAVILLAARSGGRVQFVAMAGKEIAGGIVHVGNVVKSAAAVCGGGGGGRPDMAQAGGREPEKLPEALKLARELLAQQLEEKQAKTPN
ncbi:MAG TPA: alanine--tRNA ligase, partial [Limnochordia bacterium]|nr:alanine--tRNA ligase [Limnochordia bacterium]